MFRSPTFDTFNQACTLLEALLEGDKSHKHYGQRYSITML